GVLFVQYYNYFVNFWDERGRTRLFVHLTFITCSVKFAFVLWYTWDKFTSHYGDWSYLLKFDHITAPLGVSNLIPCVICQIFYIYRCWRLSYNLYFAVPAVVSFIITTGAGLAQMSLIIAASKGVAGAFRVIFLFSNVALAAGLICDTFITCFTCFYLWRQARGLSARTENLVFRIIKLSIESATGPLLVAFANLVLNNFFTNTNSWFALPNLALTHAYGCSLLYTVNSRKGLTKGLRTMALSEGIIGARLQTILVSENHHAIPTSTGRSIGRRQFEQYENEMREHRVSGESFQSDICADESEMNERSTAMRSSVILAESEK
ncbi:hypothetical protein M422DRAFT_34325, partial [Sphaerobolus stellatus SS14]